MGGRSLPLESFLSLSNSLFCPRRVLWRRGGGLGGFLSLRVSPPYYQYLYLSVDGVRGLKTSDNYK